MSKLLSTYITEIGRGIREKTGGIVDSNDITDSLNRGIADLHHRFNVYATKNKTFLEVFEGVLEYGVESDFGYPAMLHDPTSPELDVDVKGVKEFRELQRSGRWMLSVDSVLDNRFLLVKVPGGTTTLVHGCDSLTSNGTWVADTADSDATNLTLDQLNFREGSGSFNFDVDVSQSGNDYAAIKNTTLTAIDLSSMEDLATVFLNVFIPDATNVTSILMRWGSSESNYWENSVTGAFNGTNILSGWNECGIPWGGATETGTPDSTAITYLYVRVVYSASQADDTDFRVDNIRFATPKIYDFDYFSTSFVKTSAGAYQTFFSATDDQTLFEALDDDVLFYYTMQDAQLLKKEYEDFKINRERYEARAKQLKKKSGIKKQIPTERYLRSR